LANLGVSVVLLAFVWAFFASVFAGVYWRSGPGMGLGFLALICTVIALLVSSELAAPIVVLTAVLIHGAEKRWSFSRAIWGGFGFNLLVTFLWMGIYAVLLTQEPEFGMVRDPEAEALLAKLGFGPWVYAAMPGFYYGGLFIASWLGVSLAAGSHRELWSRKTVLDWQVPWQLVWVFIGCGFGAVAIYLGILHDREDALLQYVFTSGAVLAASWFLVQGFLVVAVAIQVLRVPVWLGLLGLFLMGNALPVIGVAEIWGGFRERLWKLAEAREKADRDGNDRF